jgi:hypothetical protein
VIVDFPDEVERSLVEEMAVCHWRIRRGWAIETELWKQGIDRQPPVASAPAEVARMAAAFTDLAQTPQLGLLNRHESRLHRMFQPALKNLQTLRETRLAAEPAAEPAPAPLVETKPDTPANPPKLQICQTNPSPTPDAPAATPISAPSTPPRPDGKAA